jgi:glutathione S-transferase
MKILQTRQAPNPRRVRIFLAEKGIEVPFEELDLMKGALKTPEFTELNWFQRVPVLVLDDGTAIAETIAICRYFEEVQPEPALFGNGALGRATVEMWNRRM